MRYRLASQLTAATHYALLHTTCYPKHDYCEKFAYTAPQHIPKDYTSPIGFVIHEK
jgi:hypothetical protein